MFAQATHWELVCPPHQNCTCVCVCVCKDLFTLVLAGVLQKGIKSTPLHSGYPWSSITLEGCLEFCGDVFLLSLLLGKGCTTGIQEGGLEMLDFLPCGDHTLK